MDLKSGGEKSLLKPKAPLKKAKKEEVVPKKNQRKRIEDAFGEQGIEQQFVVKFNQIPVDIILKNV